MSNDLNLNISDEEINNAVVASELTKEESLQNIMNLTNELKEFNLNNNSAIAPTENTDNIQQESVQVNEKFNIGDYVKLEGSLVNSIPNFNENNQYKIIGIDTERNVATLSVDGESTSLYMSLDNLEKLESPFVFKEEIPVVVDNSKFAFNENEVNRVEKSTPIEVKSSSEYGPSVPINPEPVEPVVEENKTEEIVVEERGSKPIRWSTKFVEKIRDKKSQRVRVKAEKEAESVHRQEESAEKLADETEKKQNKEIEIAQEKAEKAKEKEAKKNEIKGKLVAFKTSLGDKKIKLSNDVSNKWTKMTNYLSDKKDEKVQAKETKKEKKAKEKAEKEVAKKNKKVKKETKIDNEKIENEINTEVETKVESAILTDDTMNLMNNLNPYDFYKQLPEEIQKSVIENLMSSLSFMQDQNKMVNNKIKESEEKLEQAAIVLADQNNKIEELSKGNTVETEPVEIKPIEISVVENEPVEITPVVPTPVDTISETSEEKKVVSNVSSDIERAHHILEHVQSGNYDLNQAIGREQADHVYEKIEAEKAEWEKARDELIEKNRENSESAKQKRAEKEIAEALYQKEVAIDAYRKEGLSYNQAVEKWNLEQQKKDELAQQYEQQKLEENQDDFIDIVRKKAGYSLTDAINEWNIRQPEEEHKIRM